MARPRKMINDEETAQSTMSNVIMESVTEQVSETVTYESTQLQEIAPTLETVRVAPPVISDDSDATPPICSLQGLSKEEMTLVITARIKSIIGKTQIPYIPAFVTYRDSDSTSAPPLHAIIDSVDHLYLIEAWDFYKSNAPSPTAMGFLELVRSATRSPERVFPRVAPISLM